MPAGGLRVDDYCRVYIPNNIVQDRVDLLHKHHITVTGMMNFRQAYVFPPNMQRLIEQKFKALRICQVLQDAKSPSIQLPPAAGLTNPMDSLCADWDSRGQLNYLMFVYKSTGFTRGGHFRHMMRENLIELLQSSYKNMADLWKYVATLGLLSKRSFLNSV